jgi:hypothetical protein
MVFIKISLYGLKPLPSGKSPADSRQDREHISGNLFILSISKLKMLRRRKREAPPLTPQA